MHRCIVAALLNTHFMYYRLFFLHCYDPVWYKELDLKPYWSLVCAI